MKDKIVFITGASSGIGAAAAVAFAKRGARLILAGRNTENLRRTAEQCADAGLDRQHIHFVTGDLSKEEDICNLAEAAVSKYQALDVLVNNAGVIRYNTIQQGSLEELDDEYRIHVRAVFSLCQKLVPKLIESKGCIVNVSSVASTVPYYHTTGYCAMKAAQDHMTRCLALVPECREARYMKEVDSLKILQRIGEGYPLGRVGEVGEIAEAIVYLASEDASFMTGSNMVLDGGCSLKSGI